MLYRLSADLILIAHLAFILFVALGGPLVLRWPRLIWLHLPSVAWGAISEFFGVICPLTSLETTLRQLGGAAGYSGDFIGHYVASIIYPSGLTRGIQIALGFGAVLLNLAVYGCWVRRQRKARRKI